MVSMSKLWFGVERRNWVQSRIRKDENDEWREGSLMYIIITMA
jgi:hypothetical protein